MRKGIFLISLFFILLSSSAQVWVDSGAVWHYDYSNLATGGYVKYIYEKDTIIQNKVCQKITETFSDFYFDIQGILHYSGDSYGETNYTYVSGDTVFYYKGSQFFVLFNFGASTGDSWLISTINPSGFCNDSSKVEVRATGTMDINGISYRYITLQPSPNSAIGMDGTYIERFGCIRNNSGAIQSMFPKAYQCDSLPYIVEFPWFAFRCFEDQSFPLFNMVGEDCEALFDHVGIQQYSEKELFCYPNPTNGIVNLNTPALESYSLVLYSIFGTEIQKFEISPNNSTIDMSHLPNGIYLLEFRNSKNEHVVKKIVKL